MTGDPHRLRGRILVIDDEEIVLVSARRILRRAGFEVVTLGAATEAVELLSRERFDLVMSDLMMPSMNGIELLSALRDAAIRVPVIMLTGLPTIRTAVETLRLGATDYVAKPFTRKELLNPVSRSLAVPDEWIVTGPEVQGRTVQAADLEPGMILTLPRHAWAEFQQDGCFLLGVEPSYIRSCGRIASIRHPRRMDLVEQGYPGIWLVNERDEEHNVAMPLSGQVREINPDVLADPSDLSPDTWVMRILPHLLESEVGHLLLRA